MKKVVFGLISVIVLVAASALLIPFFFNINDYKPQILAKAKEALGREVTIEGPLQLRLLPNIEISLDNVRLANAPESAQPIMASVEKVYLKVALWPLLSKKLDIQNVEIVKPVLLLERLSNGQGNWELEAFEKSESENIASANGSSVKTSKEKKAFDINVNSLKVTEGRVQYKEGKGQQEVSHVNCEVNLDSIKGSTHTKGVLTYAEKPLHYDISLGKFEETQSIQATFAVTGCEVALEGKLHNTSFQGKIKTEINLDQWEKETGSKPGLPFSFGKKALFISDVTSFDKVIKLENLQIKSENLDIQGALEADLTQEPKIQGHLENLPGGGRLVVTSHQTNQNQDGTIELDINNMKQVLEFFQQETTSLPKDLLGKSTLRSAFKITPEAVYFQGLNLDLNLTTLTGDMVWEMKDLEPALIVDIKTENILPLLALTGSLAQPHTSQKMPAALKGRIHGDPRIFVFDTQAQLGRTSIITKGKGGHTDKELQFESNVHIKSASFVNLLAQFGIDVPQIFDQMSIDGDISGKGETLQLNTSIQATDLIFQTKGTIASYSKNPQFNMSVSATHPNLKKLLGSLGTSTSAPTGNFAVEGHLEGALTSTLALNNIKGKLGTAGTFRGTVQYTGPQQNKKPYLNTALSFEAINLDNFLAFMNDATTVPAYPSSIYPQYMLAAAIPRYQSPWSHEALDLQFLNYFDAGVKLNVSHLVKGELIFKGTSLDAQIKQGILDIIQLKSQFYGGDFTLKGQINSHQNNASTCQFTVKGAELKNLSPKGGAIKITQGRMDVAGDLRTAGNSLYQWIAGLQGKITLHAQDGMISGFNLKALTSNLMNQNRLQGITNLLTTSFQQGQTPFSSLEGGFDIQKGIAHLKDMKLTAEGGVGTAQGYIDLVKYIMDVSAQFTLTDLKNLPPIGVHFTGSLDNPVRSIDSVGLEKFMTQNVLGIAKDLLGGRHSGKIKPKDVLNSLLGKSNADSSEDPQTSSADTAPPQKSNNSPLEDVARHPEKAVRGLLKGLF